MVLFILALFFSDGTDHIAVAKAPSLAECQAAVARAKPAFVGKPAGNSVVTGAEARCVVIPRSDDL